MTAISLEERVALQDAMTTYCLAVDSLSDMDTLLSVFTEDADFDMGPIGLPSLKGHAEIRDFFKQVFEDMTHHAHLITNFRVNSFEGDRASVQAYVTGMGRAKDGNEVLVYVRYFMDFVRTESGWKCHRFSEDALMPLPASLDEIHGEK